MDSLARKTLGSFFLVVVSLLTACSGGGGGGGGGGTVSSDASLVGLAISTGALSPAFSSATQAYSASVNNATDSITVTPVATSSNATIKVNGSSVASGIASSAIALTVGANPINVVVTAQDGTTTKTYSLLITRQDPPSTDATLSALTVSTGTLSPAFSAPATSYSLVVPMATASLDVTATTTSAYATITTHGSAATSGSPATVTLPVGQTVIAVVVTAQDGITTHTYNITVTRPGLTLTPAVSNIVVYDSAALTVTLASAAGSTTVVTLSSDNTPAVTVPSSVSVSAGQTQATFNATSVALGAASATITATLGADTPTATVNVSGQCAAASDCPGSDTACQTRTCTANTCGFSYAAAGTPVDTLPAGDCQSNVCDGAGGVSSVAENSDLPNDNNVCTSDICTAGVPSHPNVADGTTCPLSNSTAACTSGACAISTCNASYANCNGLTADGCETNTDSDVNNCGSCGSACGNGLSCVSGTCVVPSCTTNADCAAYATACQDSLCMANACQPFPKSSSTVCRTSAGDCDPAEYCTGVSGDCPADAFQDSGYVCRASTSICDPEEYCTGTSGSCPADDSASCDDANVCTADSCDSMNGCINTPVTDGIVCGSNLECQAGACLPV